MSVAKLSETKTTETVNKLDTELNMNTTATVETELTRLDDGEQEQIKIKEFKAKVDEMVLSLEIKPSRILQQLEEWQIWDALRNVKSIRGGL